MNKEEIFYDNLARTPKLPEQLWDKLNKKIKKNALQKRIFWAIAASIVCILGTAQYFVNNSTSNNTTAEVAEELQIIRGYLNGDDINEEVDYYMAVDYRQFNNQ